MSARIRICVLDLSFRPVTEKEKPDIPYGAPGCFSVLDTDYFAVETDSGLIFRYPTIRLAQ